MDPRQHVNPGDPIRLAASQINGLNRLLNVNAGFSYPAAVEQPTPYTWVMGKNNTGSKIERWGVLAITGMDITPGSSETATGQFEQLPVVTGGTPSATTTAWCVAVEPIAAGRVGRVAVGGVVQCKVDVTSADDKFVACKASATELKTGATGEGLILYKEGGTGAGKWALVRLAGGGAGGIVRGTFTAPWSKGSTKTVADAVTSGTTYANVKNYFAAVGGTGSKACAIAYAGGEWILIAAECA
jgi:hypothetical protein